MRRCLLALAILIGVSASAPANERPVRGAQPGTSAPTPPGIPPTLTASESLKQRALPTPAPGAQPSPGIAAQPSPSAVAAPSPSAVAQPPIVRTIVPAANGHVP